MYEIDSNLRLCVAPDELWDSSFSTFILLILFICTARIWNSTHLMVVERMKRESQLPMKYEVLVTQLCLILCDPMECILADFSVNGIFPGKNTGVGCHFLLQGNLPDPGIEVGSCSSWAPEYRLSNCWARAELLWGLWDLPQSGLNPHLLHWQVGSLPLSHKASPASILLRVKMLYLWTYLWTCMYSH